MILKDTYSLSSGEIKIKWPDYIAHSEREGVRQWLEIVTRKINGDYIEPPPPDNIPFLPEPMALPASAQADAVHPDCPF